MPEQQESLRGLIARIGVIEDEQRETRRIAQRLQQQIEALSNAQRDTAARHEATEQALLSSRGQAARFPELEEEVRQLRDRYDALRQDVAVVGQMQDKLTRLQDVENERLHLADAEILGKVEGLVGQIGELHARLAPVSENLRRLGEGLSRVGQEVEHCRQQIDALANRQGVLAEQIRRLELEIGRIEQEFEPLRAQDTVVLGRVQIAQDQVRRLDEQVQDVGQSIAKIQDLAERLQIYRIEYQRLEEKLAGVVTGVESFDQRFDELDRMIRTSDERRMALQDQILRLQQQLSEGLADLGSRMLETHQLYAQARLRDLAELERQVRDLKEHENRLKGKLG